MRLSDLQSKDIVNITTGKNIGSIIDVNINHASGTIESLVIESSKGFFSGFNRESDTLISWQNIEKIGEDVILVHIKH